MKCNTYSKSTVLAYVYTCHQPPNPDIEHFQHPSQGAPSQLVLHPSILITTLLTSITIDHFCCS